MRPFYVTGGTLAPDDPSYVPRRADEELVTALLRGEYCYVLTSRQMGKSSLMVRTAGRLREAGVRVAVLDLTAVGQHLTPEQWYYGLLDLLSEQFDAEPQLERAWLEGAHLGPCRRWMRCLRGLAGRQAAPVAVGPGTAALPEPPPAPLVVFVDEIDAVRGLPFSADEFFAAIRECAIGAGDGQAPVVFCLLGVATPADLVRDGTITPFNIGRRIELTDFTPAEAAPLARGLGSAGPALLRRVLHWTGGHPYLTQRLCRTVAERLDEGGRPSPGLVDSVCAGLFLVPAVRPRDTNLLFVQDCLLRADDDGELTERLLLYGRVLAGRPVRDDDESPAVTRLRLAGVVRTAGGLLVPRNRIYRRAFGREWVTRRLPGAELRRQRAAFWRGALRAAAGSALVLAVMAGLLVRALDSERAAQRLSDELREAARKERLAAGTARREALNAREAEGKARGAESRSGAAEKEARTALAAANRAREAERRQAARADREARAARASARAVTTTLVESLVREGMRLADAGNRPAALHPLIDALEREPDPVRRRQHRLRIASVLAGGPRLQALRVLPSGTTPRIAPGGRFVVVTCNRPDGDGDSFVWDTLGDDLRPLPRQAGRAARLAGAHPDGRRALLVYPDHVRMVDLETTTPTGPPYPIPLSFPHPAFSASGRRLLLHRAGRTLVYEVTPTGLRRLADFQAPGADEDYVARFQGEDFVLLDAFGRSTRRWHTVTGRLDPGFAARSSVLPDDPGRRLVGSNPARLLDPDTGRDRTALSGARNLSAWTFTPAGQLLGLLLDGSLWRWDPDSGSGEPLYASVDAGFEHAVLSPDAAACLTVTRGRVARFWSLETGGAAEVVARTAFAGQPSHLAERAGRVLTARAESRLEVTGGLGPAVVVRCGSRILHQGIAADGSRVVVATADGRLQWWDAVAGRRLREVALGAPARQMAVSGDGRRAAVVTEALRVWDLPTGRVVGEPWPLAGLPQRLLLDERGDHVAWLTAAAWHLTRLGPPLRHRLFRRTDGPAVLAEGRLWLGSDSEAVRVNPETGDVALHAHPRQVYCLDAGAGRVATGSRDRTARVWDARTLAPVSPPLEHAYVPSLVALDPTGTRLLTVAGEALRIWDVARGEPLTGPLEVGLSRIREARFGPADTVLVTGDQGEVVRVSLKSDLRPVADLRALAHALGGPVTPGGAGTIQPADLQEAWHRLQARYPGSLRATGRGTWHRAELREAESGRRWEAVLTHAAWLVSRDPTDWDLRRRRASALAELGRWREAATEFQAAWDRGGSSYLIPYWLGVCQLVNGDVAGYRATCRRAREFFADHPSTRARDITAWLVALGPAEPAVLREAERLWASVLAEAGARPADDSQWQTTGYLAFRAGRWRAALEALGAAAALRRGEVVAPDLYVEAMCLHALRQTAAARARLIEAQQAHAAWAGLGTGNPRSWADRAEAAALRAEAERRLATPANPP